VKLPSAGRILLILLTALTYPALSSGAEPPAPRAIMAAAASAQVPTAGGSNDPSAVPAERGRSVFAAHCVMCHGELGKGDGRVAKLYNPRPSDLTASSRTDLYKTTIIRKGGAYVGRSVVMPAWGDELSEAEIQDLVAYLRVLAAPRP
jgi:cytochrome c oxidase cbb3-type subunit 3